MRGSEPQAFAYMKRPDKALARRVARAFRMPVADLFSSTRGTPHAAAARQVLMYLLHTCHGYNYTKVGAILGRYRKTVSHGVERTRERRRTDSDFSDRVAEIKYGS